MDTRRNITKKLIEARMKETWQVLLRWFFSERSAVTAPPEHREVEEYGTAQSRSKRG
jgi:hypothetical protein